MGTNRWETISRRKVGVESLMPNAECFRSVIIAAFLGGTTPIISYLKWRHLRRKKVWGS